MALIPVQLDGKVETIMAYYNPQDFVGIPEQQALYKWNDLATKAKNAFLKGKQATKKAKALFNKGQGPNAMQNPRLKRDLNMGFGAKQMMNKKMPVQVQTPKQVMNVANQAAKN